MSVADLSLDDMVSLSGNVKEETELKQVFENLDNDKINPTNNRSPLDFNSDLEPFQITSHAIADEFKSKGIISHGITETLKRLSVSKNRKGRQEKVEIATASRESSLTQRGGILGGIKAMFTQRP